MVLPLLRDMEDTSSAEKREFNSLGIKPIGSGELHETVRLIVNIEAVTGKREELAATFASLCPSVREEPGCQ